MKENKPNFSLSNALAIFVSKSKLIDDGQSSLISTEYMFMILFNQCRTLEEYIIEIGEFMRQCFFAGVRKDRSILKYCNPMKKFLLNNDFLPMQQLLLAKIESTQENIKIRSMSTNRKDEEKIEETLQEFKEYLEDECLGLYRKWTDCQKKIGNLSKIELQVKSQSVIIPCNEKISILKSLVKLLKEGENLINRVYKDFLVLESKSNIDPSLEFTPFINLYSPDSNNATLSNFYAVNLINYLSPKKIIENIDFEDFEDKLAEMADIEFDFSHLSKSAKSPSKKQMSHETTRKIKAQKFKEKHPKKEHSLVSEIHKMQSSYKHCFEKGEAGEQCDVCHSIIEFNGLICKNCEMTIHKKCLDILMGSEQFACDKEPFSRVVIPDECLYSSCYILMDYIEEKCLNLKNIYRSNSLKSELSNFLNNWNFEFNSEYFERFSLSIFSSVLKKLLHRISGKLIPASTDASFKALLTGPAQIVNPIGAQDDKTIKSVNPDVVRKLNAILSSLGLNKKKFLIRLFLHLKLVSEHSSQNFMSAESLSLIFCPSIFFIEESKSEVLYKDNIEIKAKLTEMMINAAEEISACDPRKIPTPSTEESIPGFKI